MMKELKLVVYKMASSSIQAIGMLQEYVYLSYSPRFNEVGSFSLIIPFSLESFNLVSHEYGCEKLVLLDDGILGICHKIYISNSPTKKQIQIQGTLAEGILENFATQSYSISSYAPAEFKNIQTTLSSFVNNHQTPKNTGTWWPAVHFKMITPNDSRFVIAEGFKIDAGTGRSLVEYFAKAKNLGYSVKIATENSVDFLELQFCLYEDRTVNQSQNDPVMISTKLGDLYSSEYNLNSQNWKNAVYAKGIYANSGYNLTAQKIITYEEYPTIQDIPIEQLRSTFVNFDLTSEGELTQEEAEAILQREGKASLYDFSLIKSYNCKIKESEGTFKFNRDYFLGDKITVFDEELQLTLDAQLLEYTKSYSRTGDSFEPVLGFSQPTLNRILKQKGVI